MDPGRFVDLGPAAGSGAAMLNACLTTTSTAKPAARFMNSSGANLPIGMWRSPSCKWQKAVTGHSTPPTPWCEMLDTCLRLLHPFTPFVTEELWGHLKEAAQEKSEHFAPDGGWEEMLIVAQWPEPQLILSQQKHSL